MNTQEIKPASSGKKDNKNNTAAYAATAGAAGIAGAGVVIAADHLSDEPVEEVVEEEVVEQPVEEPVAQEEKPHAEEHVAQEAPAHTPSAQAAANHPAEPQPITQETPTDSPSGQTPEVTPASQEVAEVETEVEVPVDPNDIAQAIISETQIDPNDIDVDNVINFDDIGTVYNVEGESFAAAAFHDSMGNDLLMVDIDGDNIFDVITDPYGNIVADAPTLTVDDAEIGVSETGYLAHNDSENTDEFGDDTINQDLIS